MTYDKIFEDMEKELKEKYPSFDPELLKIYDYTLPDFDDETETVLVGNLLICRNDPETGFEKELTNDDAKLIMRHIVGVESPIDGRKWKGLRVGNFDEHPKGEIL